MSQKEIEKRAIRTAGSINEFAISTAYQYLEQAKDFLKLDEHTKYHALVRHTSQFRADEVADAIQLITVNDNEYWEVIVEKTEHLSTGVEVFFRAA